MKDSESIKLKRRLDGLHGRLSDMMDDVQELQQDIQFLYRSVEKIYDIIEEEEPMSDISCTNCYFYREHRMGGAMLGYIGPQRVLGYCKLNHTLQEEGVCNDYRSLGED